jgi:hypothetical protein
MRSSRLQKNAQRFRYLLARSSSIQKQALGRSQSWAVWRQIRNQGALGAKVFQEAPDGSRPAVCRPEPDWSRNLILCQALPREAPMKKSFLSGRSESQALKYKWLPYLSRVIQNIHLFIHLLVKLKVDVHKVFS